MPEDVAIRIEKVSKRFMLPHEKKNSVKSIFTSLFGSKTTHTNQQALKNITFDIKKGEFFGIVGRNGSGKSTLLKIIAGIYQPTQGKVTVRGKLVPFIELGVGFNPELTGRENVFLNGAILGFTHKQVQANYQKIVDFAELEEFMDQKLKNYSSGMQVRLAFACATMAEADILLVDEVLAVGDSDFQRKCFNYFRYLKKMKKTVVFVSHDMNSVREYCDTAVLIDDSRLVKQGRSNRVADEYAKLFVSINNDQALSVKTEDRQGNGNVRITKIEKINNISAKSENIKVAFSFVANKEVQDIVVGFKLKTGSDDPITGTNTQIEGNKIGILKKGELRKISFEFDNILNSGSHAVDLVVVSEAGDVFDWIIDAIQFNVLTERRTGYMVEPKFKVIVRS